MTISPESFVADVATARPAAVKVFQRYGIDFCCGGKQPLRRACATAGVPVERVIAELQATGHRPDAGVQDWSVQPLSSLVRHISENYHAPQAIELERLNAMMDKVERVHGERWPALVPTLAEIVRGLTNELLFHTNEEEDRLFPAILALERKEHVALHGRTLDRFLERLEDEHFTVGRQLEQMRALTGGFLPPDGACNTFRGLYHGLEELSSTLKEHVHLENHVLFPRAAALGRTRADAVEGL
jgi:regulator of cell morphogenesis and NO signaling